MSLSTSSRQGQHALAKTALWLLGAALFSPSRALTLRQSVEPPTKLPEWATENDLRYQPALDFDTDGCYNVPAIGCNKRVSEGLSEGSGEWQGCRDEADLDNSNVYSRQRCNNGWCAYMYDYYFEKDYAIGPGTGHRHDWEHIIVLVPDDSTVQKIVCASAHGGYDCKNADEVRWHNEVHPKIVYHKDGPSTHAFRFANEANDQLENHKKEWQLADLVSWNGFPTPDHRNILENHNFGSASFGIGHQFADNLGKLVDRQCDQHPSGQVICTNPLLRIEFDKDIDEGSPGNLPPNNGCNPPSDPEPEPEPERPDLRVLPLGDSITNGFGSSSNAGYRGYFYNLATEVHNVVDMIGSVRSGDADDADHEGHNGATIAEISGYAERVLSQRPNVVLLHAGTNDMGSDAGAVGAVNRLMNLVDMIIAKCPDATVLVARIIPSTSTSMQARINSFNDGVEDAMNARADDGKKVLVIRMDEAVGTADLIDGLHPNDLGYIIMATNWWNGVQQAFENRWIDDPVAGQPPDNGGGGVVCGTVPTWIPQGTTASGGGLGSAALENNATGVFMADIDGDGRDDYLHVSENGEVYMYWNIGKAPDEGPNAGKVQWQPVGVIASGGGAQGHQVRFADIDGDGRSEFIWVKDSGSATVWWNRGFASDGQVKVIWGPGAGEEIATGIGDGQGVRFADMNGDGKADFIHLAENGAATLYINQGRRETGGWGWWNWGVIASGVGTSRENIRFADLNGDGRDDYIAVESATGGLNAWYNRGPQSQNWAAVTPLVWWNPGSIASGVSYLPNWSTSNMVTFGDLNGDSRDEYLYIGVEDSSVYAFLNGC
ncbi:uncharacterized protein CLUP02_13172 [Colletotrichum lupini]|uniref:SGNH hydrolase-type esterase domain-containing protein n=1 Tax=Colletotrichum lupini TaxID=145971 RepID=A0A9Q8WLC9_9PEZI|nr:uncharacterized protein CLUP02_13172 [Colletotrichum lupini]UQC87654.1 hypothetical protein CLUP02_13172 [Colletotrichum lupini]